MKEFFGTLALVVLVFVAFGAMYMTGYDKGQEVTEARWHQSEKEPNGAMMACFYIGNELADLDSSPESILLAEQVAEHCGADIKMASHYVNRKAWDK